MQSHLIFRLPDWNNILNFFFWNMNSHRFSRVHRLISSMPFSTFRCDQLLNSNLVWWTKFIFSLSWRLNLRLILRLFNLLFVCTISVHFASRFNERCHRDRRFVHLFRLLRDWSCRLFGSISRVFSPFDNILSLLF